MSFATVKKCEYGRGFTLTETLAALTIGTIVLVVVLAIYSRAQTGAAGVTARIESNRLPREILQRISEDLDRITSSGQETRISIDNKFQDGYAVARLEIVKTIVGARNQQQTLERVVWQSSVEPEGIGKPGLTLYRSHSGIALEDNLLDTQKEPWQRELYVPICTGLTFFSVVVVPDVNTVLDKWSNENLPPVITVTLSFAEPRKTEDGTLDVPQEEMITRTIAIDRTRKPAFTMPPPPDLNQPDMNRPDANSGLRSKEPNEQTGESLPPPPPPSSR
jgi:prepilin-type N-terminal cleavage/methylation domain-containing protein